MKRGSILVLSIWILVFFSILSAGIYRIVSSQIQWIQRVEERTIAHYLAKSALTHAQWIRSQDQTSYDTLHELKQKQEKEMGHGKFIYTMSDEESKINVNLVEKAVLERIPGLGSSLAEAIINSTLRPFQLKEELLRIEGMTPQTFEQVKDFITVYSDGTVNINTAGHEILMALGFDESLTSLVGNFRKGPDLEEGTEDDGVFETTAEIVPKLNSYGGLSLSQSAFLNQIIAEERIGVSSKDMTLQISTQILDKAIMDYTVIMDKQRVRQWREQ